MSAPSLHLDDQQIAALESIAQLKADITGQLADIETIEQELDNARQQYAQTVADWDSTIAQMPPVLSKLFGIDNTLCKTPDVASAVAATTEARAPIPPPETTTAPPVDVVDESEGTVETPSDDPAKETLDIEAEPAMVTDEQSETRETKDAPIETATEAVPMEPQETVKIVDAAEPSKEAPVEAVTEDTRIELADETPEPEAVRPIAEKKTPPVEAKQEAVEAAIEPTAASETAASEEEDEDSDFTVNLDDLDEFDLEEEETPTAKMPATPAVSEIDPDAMAKAVQDALELADSETASEDKADAPSLSAANITDTVADVAGVYEHKS